MPYTIPNVLTLLRILLIPLFVGVFYFDRGSLSLHQQNIISTVLFVLAAVTDGIDGWLARRLKQTTAFGAFLDPVADKLMVAAALIVLLQLGRVDAVISIIIIGREIAISALREWMAARGKRNHIAVSFAGKVKTAAQMVAIPLLLYDQPIEALPGFEPHRLGTALIVVAAALTLISMAYYLRSAWPHIARHR